VHGSRSAALFDFLAEMDTPQIIEMVKNESNTVKAIILTQCDSKKRQGLFNAHDDATRLKLMTELSRIDHLPKNYIYNVAQALRRKKIENPKLNTEALPGTDVLVSFLEKADIATQRTIVHQLMGTAGGEALQNLKSKLISIETLRFIRDQQLIEVITHVKHEELVQFLKACSVEVRESILNKAPAEMAADLKDGINLSENVSKETYLSVERKLLNRMKVLANNGQFNIAAINERIFTEEFGFQNQASEIASVDMRRVG
jgi:flagellar motor switch protein FliG